MNCPVCNTELPPKATECPNCGAFISWEDAQATPVEVRDTGSIRRLALMQMAAELARKRQYEAALLTYRRALKGLNSDDPLHAEIRKHIQRIKRQHQSEAEKSPVSPALLTDQNALKQPPDSPAETKPDNLAPARFWVRMSVAYLVGMALAVGLGQILRLVGFQWEAQVVFVLMLIWAAYSGQLGLLTLEWFVGFGGSYLFFSGLAEFRVEQWISLALEGLILDLIFFYGSQASFGVKAGLGLALAALVFVITPLFPLSILQLFLENYLHILGFLALLFFTVNRSPGNWFHRLFSRLCQTH